MIFFLTYRALMNGLSWRRKAVPGETRKDITVLFYLILQKLLKFIIYRQVLCNIFRFCFFVCDLIHTQTVWWKPFLGGSGDLKREISGDIETIALLPYVARKCTKKFKSQVDKIRLSQFPFMFGGTKALDFSPS